MRTVEQGLGVLAAKLRLAAARPNLLGYLPHDRQRAFHCSTAQIRLFIGGNRSGKTVGGATEGLYRARGVHPFQRVPPPPTRGRVVVSDFPHGWTKIAQPVVAQWVVPSDLIGGSWEDSWSRQDRTLSFANGSTMEVLSTDSELDKHAGSSRHWVWVDEEQPKPYWVENRARIIDTGGRIWMTMTAVDGQTWSYDDLYVPGLGLEGKAKDPRIFVVQVSMFDNPHIGQEERLTFLSGLSEDDRAARVEGKYNVVGGLVFKRFSPGLHVVAQQLPPADWGIFASMDHGLNAPTSWHWHGVGPQGRILTFHEEYGAEITVPDWAARVLAYEDQLGRPVTYRVGDPSIAHRQQANGMIVSVQGDYLKHGVSILLGNNDFPTSVNRIRRYLERPGMWQLTEDCPQLNRQMQRYRWRTPVSARTRERTNPYEQPVKKDDHAVDDFRYFVMSRPDLGTLAPQVPAGPALPGMPGGSTTSRWPWERVAAQVTRVPVDPDSLSPQEWEINESVGAYW